MAAIIWIVLVISNVAFLPTLEAVFEPCSKVSGRLAAALTPTNDCGGICLECIRPYAQYLKDKGVDGVVVAASTGEGTALNVTENKRLLDAWKEAATLLDLYLVSSVGGGPLSDTQEMARYSAKICVDAIMAKPVVGCRPVTEEELLINMMEIAKFAPTITFLYDDIPQYTGVYVNIVKFVALAVEKIPNFGGVKSSYIENLLKLRPIITGKLKLFAGNYFYLAPEVFMGFDNYVLDVLNILPTLVIDIIETGQSCYRGSQAKTISLYQLLVDLNDDLNDAAGGNRIAALKATMPFVSGIYFGDVLLPQVPLNEDQKDQIERVLIAYGFRTFDDCAIQS